MACNFCGQPENRHLDVCQLHPDYNAKVREADRKRQAMREEEDWGSASLPRWDLAKIVDVLEASLLKVLNPGTDEPHRLTLSDAADVLFGELVGSEEGLPRRFHLRTVDTQAEAVKAAIGRWQEPWSEVVKNGGHLTQDRVKALTLVFLCIVGPENRDDTEDILARWSPTKTLSVAARRAVAESNPDILVAVREFMSKRLDRALKDADGSAHVRR